METRPLLARPAGRWVRATGVWAAGFSTAAALVYYVAPLAGRGFLRLLQGVGAGCVWLVTSVAVGVSLWDVARTVARATLGSVLTLGGSIALSVLVVIG